jgi:starch phosphorylase
MRVVYLEDYRVTLAELLTPAADLSEQISLAGTEASGTSNMKFMINGAVTIGTLDGANVEIHDAVGDDNIILFGMTASEVEALKPNYDPRKYFNGSPVIKQAVEELNTGFCCVKFNDIADSLLNHDPYMVLADFESYAKAQKKAEALYGDAKAWQRMCLINTANAGRFAADRAIREYAEKIWHARPLPEEAAKQQAPVRRVRPGRKSK